MSSNRGRDVGEWVYRQRAAAPQHAAGMARREGVGHLERVANPNDRRSSLLRTTRSGREAMVGQVLPLAAEVERIAAGLSEEELATVAGFVREVTAATTRQARNPGGAVDGPPDGPG